MKRTIYVPMVLTCLISLLITPSILSDPSPEDPEPKTYAIWSVTVSGDYIRALQTISDVNDNGYEDFLVASYVTGNGYIFLMDGKTGSIIEQQILGYDPREAVYINNYVAVAREGGVDVYDSQLKKLYTISASATDVTPENLQTFDRSDIVFVDSNYVKSYLLSTGGKNWEVHRPNAATYGNDLLVLSPHRAIFAYAYSWIDTSEWRFDLIDDDGNVIQTFRIRDSAYYDDIYLNPYDQVQFLYSKTNDTMTVLRCDSIIGDSLTILWETQIDKYYRNKGFVINDINGDGGREVVAVWGGYITVFDGADGSLIYMTEVDVDYYSFIIDVAVLSDIDGDGVREVAVQDDYYTYFISFKESSSNLYWELWEGGYGVETIQDVDGDGLKDMVVAEYNDLYCFWGNYDDDYPSISLVSPDEDSYISNVTFQVDASDEQSGIDYVKIYIYYPLYESYDAIYNATSGYYEIMLTDLTEGDYSWYAYTYDRVENYKSTSSRSFTLDLTAPTLTINSPSNGSYIASSNVNLTWSASDPHPLYCSGIEHYELKIDAESWIIIEDTSYMFTGVNNGDHVVYVRAVDKVGNVNETPLGFIVDTTSPSLSITSPSSGETFRSSSVTIVWSGSDAVSGIDHYEVRIDGGSWNDVGASEEHTFTKVGDGTHIVEVKAVDKAGLSEEGSVSFTVNTSPIGGSGYAEELIIGFVAVVIIGVVVYFLKRT